MTDQPKLNFEDALEELESIVTSMEEGQLSLEDLVDQFERGTKLQKHCTNMLSQISDRIEKLKKSASSPAETTDSEAPAEEPNTDDKDELLF